MDESPRGRPKKAQRPEQDQRTVARTGSTDTSQTGDPGRREWRRTPSPKGTGVQRRCRIRAGAARRKPELARRKPQGLPDRMHTDVAKQCGYGLVETTDAHSTECIDVWGLLVPGCQTARVVQTRIPTEWNVEGGGWMDEQPSLQLEAESEPRAQEASRSGRRNTMERTKPTVDPDDQPTPEMVTGVDVEDPGRIRSPELMTGDGDVVPDPRLTGIPDKDDRSKNDRNSGTKDSGEGRKVGGGRWSPTGDTTKTQGDRVPYATSKGSNPDETLKEERRARSSQGRIDQER
ncbi:hypothetical protein FB45DRAFT_871008 [Roridomyces roridus]|uniref:Uncharacterized protein n=1 Tax=Roridomyces roridus TaxID=1738132 RepID=A0AAD7FIW7_9AGAR|nr:hypothetical protein FB45DRAFT_871008 [Roridomyces roridus]